MAPPFYARQADRPGPQVRGGSLILLAKGRSYTASGPVAPAPDAHLLGVLDELLPEIRVGDGDDLLRPLPGGDPLQIQYVCVCFDVAQLDSSVAYFCFFT